MADETIETPYSKGERLEPSLHINPDNIYGWPGPKYLVDQFEDFGKVDFNDQDENEIVTVWVSVDEEGNRLVHVHDHNTFRTHEMDLGV